jgi:hypothetical protein
MTKSGGIYTIRELSTECGFTELSGQPPDCAVLDAAVQRAMEKDLPEVTAVI